MPELNFLIIPIYTIVIAGIANMAPVLFKKVNFLNYPLDFNKKIGQKPILGKNKTFRGFFFGILCAILSTVAISFLPNTDFIKNPIIFGFLIGFGALAGDSIKSFFKRRIDIKPGEMWVPFDQIDWIIGGLILIEFYVMLNLIQIISALIIGFFLHFVFNYLGYLLKIKKNKF